MLCNTLDGRAKLWDYAAGRTRRTYAGGHVNTQFCISSGFLGGSSSASFDLGCSMVVTGSEDGSLAAYDISTGHVVGRGAAAAAAAEGGGDEGSAAAAAAGGVAGGHTAAVLSVNVHPSAPLVATGGHHPDNSVRVWAASRTEPAAA